MQLYNIWLELHGSWINDRNDYNVKLIGASMKPIHVLVLIKAMDRAGAATIAMNYMRNIDRDKIKYDFLVNIPDKSDYEDEIETLGGKVYHMESLCPGKVRLYKKEFRNFLNNHREYQVIHSYLEEKSYYPLKIAKEMGVPIRICHGYSHTTCFSFKLPAKFYLKLRMRRYYTHGMACSSEVARWMFGAIGVKDAIIMKNSVDTSVFKKNIETSREIRQEFGLDEKLVIGHVGRFVREKNQKFLINVFSEIHRRNPNSVLLLVGGGDNSAEIHYKEKVKERVREMRLESSVIFAGVRNDVERMMQAFDVLVMPSMCEGFPVALVEAQSLGLRCVVSDNITPKCNLVGNMEFLPLELRASVWAGRILQLLNKPFEDKAYKVVDKGYDIKSNANRMQRFYISETKKYKILENTNLR